MPKEFTPSREVLKALYDVALEHSRLIPGVSAERLERIAKEIAADTVNVACVEWTQTYGVECRLYFGVEYTGIVETGGKKYRAADVVISVAWSDMYRSPARARAAIALYSAVTDLACLLESVAGEWRVGDEVEDEIHGNR